MHPARRLLIAFALLLVGYFGWTTVTTRFPSDATWEAQILADAETAITVLKPYEVESLPEEFADRWRTQLEPYDDERRADLRGRLHLYLDFLEAEYAEAADVYTSGSDPRQPSAAIRDLRARLPAAFGDVAARMIADADELREHAYRMSPRHGGLDPDAPDFRLEAAAVRDWMSVARPRVDALTAAPEQR